MSRERPAPDCGWAICGATRAVIARRAQSTRSSLTILRRVGDRYHEGIALWQIGVAAQQQGDFEIAQDAWWHALSILETLCCAEAEEVRGLLAREPAGAARPTARTE
jgi:protein-disulfide isomerase-like protein with CxxC motif